MFSKVAKKFKSGEVSGKVLLLLLLSAWNPAISGFPARHHNNLMPMHLDSVPIA